MTTRQHGCKESSVYLSEKVKTERSVTQANKSDTEYPRSTHTGKEGQNRQIRRNRTRTAGELGRNTESGRDQVKVDWNIY